MDLTMNLKAILLALICGVTEFLPVSSNGHVIVLKELLHFSGPSGKIFELSLQLGAISAVCWLYREKLLRTACGATRNVEDRLFALKILIAFLPAAVMGFVFHHYITEHLFNSHVVAMMLLLGGVIILLVEHMKPVTKTTSVDTITPMNALVIGLFQVLSLIPGVSRSGSTIVGALLLGIDRKVATEFSFFLAIPIIFIAGIYEVFKNRQDLADSNAFILLVGFAVSFVCAIVVVKWLLKYLSRHSFVAFAWYRIVAGSAVMAFLWLK
jgi:undecaprenyl-diphosphatase